MATHSSVLAWRIPGMGEPGGLPSMGSHRAGHDCSDLAVAEGQERKPPRKTEAPLPDHRDKRGRKQKTHSGVSPFLSSAVGGSHSPNSNGSQRLRVIPGFNH